MTPRERRQRRINHSPNWGKFGPLLGPSTGEIFLRPDELEALRLCDHEGFSQKEAAREMDVSQPTFHRILRAGRKKVSQALTEGKVLYSDQVKEQRGGPQ